MYICIYVLPYTHTYEITHTISPDKLADEVTISFADIWGKERDVYILRTEIATSAVWEDHRYSQSRFTRL